MKVLAVIETMGYGGAERQLVSMLPALASKGIRCELAVLWPPYDLAPQLEKSSVRVHRLNLAHRWMLPQAVWRLARICRRIRPTVVWGHLYLGMLYSRLLKLFDPKLIVVSSLHSSQYSMYPVTTTWHRVRRVLDRVSGERLADEIVAVSNAVKSDYETHLGYRDVKVIHNAVPAPEIRELGAADAGAVRREYSVMEGEFLVVLPGRHAEVKGHRFLIEAMKIAVEREGMRTRLVAPGGGPDRSSIEEVARRCGVEDCVHLIDPLPQALLFKLMGAADAVVMPSTSEGLSVAAAETMALGVPLVLSAVGGNVELASDGETALFVPPCDPGAIARRLAQLRDDPALRGQLGRNATRRIAENFSLPIIADQWAEALSQLSHGAGQCR